MNTQFKERRNGNRLNQRKKMKRNMKKRKKELREKLPKEEKKNLNERFEIIEEPLQILINLAI